ncbi:MAG: lytic transglycosylase domain-containing protein [Roseovarius sp.]
MLVRLFLLVLLQLSGPALATPPDTICSSDKWGPPQCIRKAHFVYDTCNAIETFATRHGLDPHFFARLIWQESRFDPNALSPANARGIAQFIPSTARLRGLGDPYNPAEALDHSAHYLAEMARRYGNLGLAAIGYNGGERRAEGLIAGTGGLARETVDYVRIITGVPYQNWTEKPVPAPDLRLSHDLPFDKACFELARNRRMTALKSYVPKVQPWGIQMAFGITKEASLAKFRSQTRACAGLIGKEEPDLLFQKSRASPKGGYFMARLGRETRDAARDDCEKFRAAGCICRIYRND